MYDIKYHNYKLYLNHTVYKQNTTNTIAITDYLYNKLLSNKHWSVQTRHFTTENVFYIYTFALESYGETACNKKFKVFK